MPRRSGVVLPTAVRREALELAGELMARRIPHGKVVRSLVDKYGVGERSAWTFVSNVLASWKAEDERLLAYRRAEARRSVHSIIASAVAGDRRYRGRDDQGQPVYDRIPDRQSALQGERLLARIDGLLDTTETGGPRRLLDSVLEDLAAEAQADGDAASRDAADLARQDGDPDANPDSDPDDPDGRGQ